MINKLILVEKSHSPISVVIPLFNKKNTIRRALKSVIEQMHHDDEVIIIDDGSTDGGANDLSQTFSSEVRLRIIKQKNMGVSIARNRGIEEAIHDHIVFLDADDWWLQGFRGSIAKLIRNWPSAVAWTVGHYRVNGESRVFIKSGILKDGFFSGTEFIDQYGKHSGLINSSSVCVRRDSIQSIGCFPEGVTNGEDIFVWLSLALIGGIAFDPEPLVAIDRPPLTNIKISNRDQVGFHYLHFAKKNVLDTLNADHRSVLKKFMIKNGLMQIGGLLALGKRKQSFNQVKTMSNISPSIWLLLIPIFLLPRKFFQILYKFRHK